MISGIYTGLMLAIFIGIFLWAWSHRNKKTFEDLSQLPLESDDEKSQISMSYHKNHNAGVDHE